MLLEAVHKEGECHLEVWEEAVHLLEAWAEVVHHLAWAEEDLVVLVAPVVQVVLEDLQEEEECLQEWEEVVLADQEDHHQELPVVPLKMQLATYLETKRVHCETETSATVLELHLIVSN